jgi:hypothetical protein
MDALMEDKSPHVVTQSFTKFCPACKFGNDANALTCIHCGSSLDLIFTKSVMADKGGQYAAPAQGMAFYFAGSATQIAIATEEEFILGRKAEGDTEPMVDLTYPDGFAMGVSRRHAKIRSTPEGYLITDLNSSNGTWLDGKILAPSQAVELPSGGTVQLGRLKLVTIYNTPGNK